MNLRTTPAERLAAPDGVFRAVLRVLQQREAGLSDFRQVLEEVLTHLEALPGTEADRWREMLTYLHVLVYNVRSEPEQEPLLDLLADSARTSREREDAMTMRKTGADVLMERGRKEGRKQGIEVGARKALRKVLLNSLSARFGNVPASIVQRVEETTDLAQLEGWLQEFATAATLEEMSLARG